MRNIPETKCDICIRAATCYQEGRLFGYTSLADMEVRPEFGRHGHAMIGIGESCARGINGGCIGCADSMPDEIDGAWYCRFGGRWEFIEDVDLVEGPEWCPYKG